jgi:hypothetical protein
MQKIVIQILASDIRESDYIEATDCAMTRAFHRAGLNMYEAGGEIKHSRFIPVDDKHIINTPIALQLKVIGMYRQHAIETGAFVHAGLIPDYDKNTKHECPPIPIEDFEFEMEIPGTVTLIP